MTDGRTDPYRRSEGKQSLKLMNASDIRLPLNHLYQSVLYVSMKLLIGEGCIASVRVNNLNGADLELYFKSNRKCDILINHELQSEIPYTISEWIPVQISLYSKGSEIWIKAGSTDISIPWIFTGGLVHAGELEIASSPGTIWPVDGQPLFHVDNIEIRATGSVSVESVPVDQEIFAYPNPATETVFLETPPDCPRPVFSVTDLNGRAVSPEIEEYDRSRWRMNVANLAPGIYLITIRSGGFSRTGKFLIFR
jgi:hypothetical protein